MKFISHLELISVIERAFRRADIPLKFSQGFNPHPKISFAAPLSVGVSSEGEYLTVEIQDQIDIDDFKNKVNIELPKGIEFIKCKYIDPKSKALMSIVEDATYIVKCVTKEFYDSGEIDRIIEAFLDKKEILYKKIGKRKKEKIINIRNYIKSIIVLAKEDNEIILKLTVSTGSQGNLKPEVLVNKLVELEKIKIDLDKLKIHRLDIFSSKENKSMVPIDRTI
jgi:radical SAM-linked protein